MKQMDVHTCLPHLITDCLTPYLINSSTPAAAAKLLFTHCSRETYVYSPMV